jgi:hypothetical protein
MDAHPTLSLPQLIDALKEQPGLQQLPPTIQQRLLTLAAQLYEQQHPKDKPGVVVLLSQPSFSN